MVYFTPELVLGIFILVVMILGIYYSALLSGFVGFTVTLSLGLYILGAFNVLGAFYDSGVNTWVNSHKLLTTLAGLIVLLILGNDKSSHPLLLLMVVLGGFTLISAENLLTAYLGIELQTLSLLILVAKRRSSIYSSEAGLKYFVLSALASGILLLGVAIIYGTLGNVGIIELSLVNSKFSIENIGKTFIAVALLFKLAAAPFHFWAPDIYDGAAVYTTAVLVIIPKFSYFSVLVQLMINSNLLLIAGIVSILVGALGALNQTKLKRLLAYSGIMNMGFILLGLGLNCIEGTQVSFIYIVIYIITSILLFTTLISIRAENLTINDVAGLSRKAPLLGLLWGLGFLSSAGIPPLLGFYAKWIVLITAISKGFYAFSIFAIAAAVLAAVYYVRIVLIAYFQYNQLTAVWNTVLADWKVTNTQSVIIGASSFFIITGILWPNLIVQAANWATTSLI